MKIDYHTHNHFSVDSSQSTIDLIEHAIKMGIDEICITNHIETFPQDGGTGIFTYEEAFERFTQVKKEIDDIQKDFPNIKIKFGAELEYIEEWMPEMKRLVDDIDFDFLIGSVHVVDEVVISNTELSQELYKKVDEEHTYSRYFEQMFKMVEWGNFSVVGHFDVCKKGGTDIYGPFNPEKHKKQIIPILELMKQKGIGIELNTSGLRSNCKEIYPHTDILKWCKEIGIEHYTTGSDGHETKDIGWNIDKAMEILKEIGIKTISTYEKRIPTKFEI
ncbi:histidinol-phosphatase [Candidatus Peregrinibacteria bacterium]|nr:histidinol-phosphatase [Candidatus Peregrinibacteria bacterium]